MIKVNCFLCKLELTEPGALLFGPPYEGAAHKDHICGGCYTRLLELPLEWLVKHIEALDGTDTRILDDLRAGGHPVAYEGEDGEVIVEEADPNSEGQWREPDDGNF